MTEERKFDVDDKNARKYQCFVCATQFLDFDEYKKHIIDSHDEGRDYVKCPLERCGTPVRDVRLHFKVFHPREICPRHGQLKAIVWRDVKDGKAKAKKPQVKTGFYESVKMGRKFQYRSGYEETVFEQLDSDQDVLGFDVEPFQIPYLWKAEQHHYTPDVLVYFVDGTRELWEIKPANQTALEQNQCKKIAADEYCLVRGWKFRFITEQSINALKTKVHRQRMDDC